MQSCFVASFLAALMVFGVAWPCSAQPLSREGIQMALSKASGPLIPRLDGASIPALAASETGQALLAWARAGDFDIPQTTYTLYRTYRKDGTRRPYERPYFAKREMLVRAVMLAWLGEDAAAQDHVNDLLWSLCEETNWVAPAHETRHRKIDLFAA